MKVYLSPLFILLFSSCLDLNYAEKFQQSIHSVKVQDGQPDPFISRDRYQLEPLPPFLVNLQKLNDRQYKINWYLNGRDLQHHDLSYQLTEQLSVGLHLLQCKIFDKGTSLLIDQYSWNILITDSFMNIVLSINNKTVIKAYDGYPLSRWPISPAVQLSIPPQLITDPSKVIYFDIFAQNELIHSFSLTDLIPLLITSQGLLSLKDLIPNLTFNISSNNKEYRKISLRLRCNDQYLGDPLSWSILLQPIHPPLNVQANLALHTPRPGEVMIALDRWYTFTVDIIDRTDLKNINLEWTLNDHPLPNCPVYSAFYRPFCTFFLSSSLTLLPPPAPQSLKVKAIDLSPIASNPNSTELEWKLFLE